MKPAREAVVVGAGPNGLAAAVTMARAGIPVTVLEGMDDVGGAARTVELSESGFVHDVGAAVHPMAAASPFFRAFELLKRVQFVTPEVSYGHPITPHSTGVAYRSLERTCDRLGVDGRAWRHLLGPLVDHVDELTRLTCSSPVNSQALSPTAMAFAYRVLKVSRARAGFAGDIAAALIGGVAAHSPGNNRSPAAAAVALTLATHAHVGGWPIPIGGSGAITRAMRDDLLAHGGEIHAGTWVRDLRQVGNAVTLFDLTPRGYLQLDDGRLPHVAARRLQAFTYGPAACKVDYTLDGPVSWLEPALNDAATVHLGGTRAQMAHSEAEVRRGRHARNPVILVSQPSRFDPTRAPLGKHVLWAYAHVPAGSDRDITETITSAIEQHAPGFRDLIRTTTPTTALGFERLNPNLVGGDILSGATTLSQVLARPTLAARPWRLPRRGHYLCSASTSPGPGVHGLAGYWAARTALRDMYGITEAPHLGL